ncbi:MAG: S-methyl-5-thioribose-1-phosphate isomerase [Thiothrix sp.]|nr:MAG: S-methyl-5-thioribose-1-phosphate isomerase [Thiothrix sp.]
MPLNDTIRAVEWKDNHLILLDQRKLPHAEQYLQLYNAEDTADAIRNMVVRGAPAIGITAAYGLLMAARKAFKQYPHDWRSRLQPDIDVLAAARPTAINLHWALQRMLAAIDEQDPEPINTLMALAQTIHQEDIDANHRMAFLGNELIKPTHGVLTHCNTGSLATGGYGTALGVIRTAYSEGKIEQVYADETRPWWQGSRLTAWELMRDKIPTQLICEGAAAHLMKLGKISWVIVGADRIAANGDVANKIGTYSLAVLARFHGVRFMVVAPTSTIDMDTPTGEQIPIEERSPEEILNVNQQRIAALQVSAWNPAFDVTPGKLVDILVTEKGIVVRPDNEKLNSLLQRS